MLAYYVKVPRQFELRTVEVGPLAPDEALVQVKACGVCGWDVLVATQVATDWMGIGHEFSGVVAEVGSAVTAFKPGDRVVVENATYCGLCRHCKNGDVIHCTHLFHYLSPGAFAEYVRVKAQSLIKSGELDFPTAALAEPLTVAIDMVEAAEIPLGARVAVFGPGPIGLMIARLARLVGASKVYLTGHSHSRRRWEVARKLGVDELVFVDQMDVREYFRQQEPEGLDRVLVTSPPNTVADAIAITRFGGIITYNGIKFGDAQNISFDGNDFHFRRLQLRGVHSIPNLGWPKALDLLQRRVIDPDDFISHRFSFNQVPEAIACAIEQRSETVKVMVIWP
jgi:L-iditol 2-dehydrogenase